MKCNEILVRDRYSLGVLTAVRLMFATTAFLKFFQVFFLNLNITFKFFSFLQDCSAVPMMKLCF